MATIQFDILPYVSPNYQGDHYIAIRKKISHWMTRVFNQRPDRLFVDMRRNRGTATYYQPGPVVRETIQMIWEHPMGQVFFAWNQGLKNRHTDSQYQGPRPKLSLPGINYTQRFAECRYQAAMDAQYLDQLDFEEEGVLASMLSEIALTEADQTLDEVDKHMDELHMESETESEPEPESHPLILEFSSDEESSDEEDDEEPIDRPKFSQYYSMTFKDLFTGRDDTLPKTRHMFT